MTQRNKNLRNVVDGVFRQSSPATPQRIVQDVLSDESRDSRSSESSTTLTPKRTTPLPTTKFIAPETSLTLPAVNVTPIVTDNSIKSVAETDGKAFWSVFSTVVILIVLAFLAWHFFPAIQAFFVENFTQSDAVVASAPPTEKPHNQQAPVSNTITHSVTVVTPPDAPESALAPESSSAPQPTERKNVTFDESKNVVRYIDTSGAPLEDARGEMRIASSPLTTDSDGAKQMTTEATTVFQLPTSKEATLKSLELSLDTLAKTNLDLQAQHDAAINATKQREQGSCMRLNESQQYSLTDRLAPIIDADARDDAQKIYDRDGGNSVVGNRTMAPFVTFAPGEEPFDGMIPDYDETEHGEGGAPMPPPLQSGKPHGILELINDHCMRTGKPMPKAGNRSALDIMSKKDTEAFAPMRVADTDGHYLQSQKKQFELARMNASAIKKIYADKRAASAGQILDRGDAILTQFAGAQGNDSVQYLNVNSL